MCIARLPEGNRERAWRDALIQYSDEELQAAISYIDASEAGQAGTDPATFG